MEPQPSSEHAGFARTPFNKACGIGSEDLSSEEGTSAMCLLEQVSSSLGTVPVTAGGPGWPGICPGEVPDVMSDYNVLQRGRSTYK